MGHDEARIRGHGERACEVDRLRATGATSTGAGAIRRGGDVLVNAPTACAAKVLACDDLNESSVKVDRGLLMIASANRRRQRREYPCIDTRSIGGWRGIDCLYCSFECVSPHNKLIDR